MGGLTPTPHLAYALGDPQMSDINVTLIDVLPAITVC